MKRTYTIMLGAGIMSIFAIVIAYAALSTSLTITSNKVTQNALTWNVALVTGTLTAATEGTSATGRSCGSATVTATAITVADTTLSKPGDGCVYTFTVKNSGTIAAKLGTVTPTSPSGITCTNSGASMVCGNITYKITTDAAGNTVASSSNTTVAANNGTKTLYLVVRYTGTSVNSSAVTHTGAKFTFPFNQA